MPGFVRLTGFQGKRGTWFGYFSWGGFLTEEPEQTAFSGRAKAALLGRLSRKRMKVTCKLQNANHRRCWQIWAGLC